MTNVLRNVKIRWLIALNVAQLCEI